MVFTIGTHIMGIFMLAKSEVFGMSSQEVIGLRLLPLRMEITTDAFLSGIALKAIHTPTGTHLRVRSNNLVAGSGITWEGTATSHPLFG